MIFSVRHTSVWKMSSVLGMLVHGECLQCQACSGDVFRVSHAGKMSSASRTLGGGFSVSGLLRRCLRRQER